ncbi:MAG: F0F1 ATP synthase subunit alpha, partial [Bacteroidaceae bacterium]|nr:F0F1 ATP synthase subunit alpha [Bacteroidaceae bacterium]
FNRGFRPAVNVGISVSRVGGNAQIKSMKSVAGTLKIDQAQYRELEAFAKFGTDVDAVTMMVIERGRRTNALLVQPQYSPMPVGEQVALLYCGTKNLLQDIPVDKVPEFETMFLDVLRSRYKESVLDTLASGVIDATVGELIAKVASEVVISLK